MCKINLNRLEETDILPFRIGTRKNIKVNHDSWVFFYHYFHPENDPYKLSKRIIENNIGKSFDLAFSYYCSKVEKRYQDIFLNEFNSVRYWRRIPKYYIDDNGLIQTNIKFKKQPVIIYSKDYKIEEYNILTGLKIERWKWLNYQTGLCEVFGNYRNKPYFTKWYNLKKEFIGQRVISGTTQTFESKNDPRYIRIISERNKQQKIKDKLEKSKRWKISDQEFRRILKEKELKERQLNLIKIESHGFDINTSFRK